MYLLVTGASKGIGLELTRQGLAKGHRIIAVARQSQKYPELINLRAEGNLEILDLDLADLNSEQTIAAFVEERFPQLDLVINNAGVYYDDDSAEDFELSFLINTIKPFLITRSLKKLLKKGNRPVSLQITSQMGSIEDNHSGGSRSYRASKAALNMIFKGVSIEEPWLISLLVHPGWVRTRMGGESAPISPEDSALGIWNLIDGASSSDSGTFLNYLGKKIPW